VQAQLLLKVLVTPCLIVSATLLGRRFGPSVSGWLVGFPFTSAPVSVFLTLEQGPTFAASAAVGSVASVIAQAAFAAAYTRARRHGWAAATLLGSVAFAATGLVLDAVNASPAALAVLSAAVLVGVVRLMPTRLGTVVPATPLPPWDLPARALAATALVVELTAVAPLLGPLASAARPVTFHSICSRLSAQALLTGDA
jgi:hypothetical protein